MPVNFLLDHFKINAKHLGWLCSTGQCNKLTTSEPGLVSSEAVIAKMGRFGGVVTQMANGPPTWINTCIFPDLNMCIYVPDISDCSTYTPTQRHYHPDSVPFPSNIPIYHNHTHLTAWHDMRATLRIQIFPHGESHESTMRYAVQLHTASTQFSPVFRLCPSPREWNNSHEAAAATCCWVCG